MDDNQDRAETTAEGKPRVQNPLRFGSYTGLFYVAAIVGVLSWAVFRDTGTTHAFDRLEPGMTPTQVAALLGVPRTETSEGSLTVQTWKIPDGQVFTVEFRDGHLVEKHRASGAAANPKG